MIPVNEPLIAKNTLKYVTDCIQTGWISSAGTYIRKFEEEFSRYLKAQHAVTTTSGTTALHLALSAVGIGPGDEVIIPALTMIAVPYAVLYTGARPVLVDVDSETFNLDPRQLTAFIQKECRFDRRNKVLLNKKTKNKVKALLPVHLYGHPCSMDRILAAAREYNLAVVEDAAEAHGALYYPDNDRKKERYVGTIGDIGCFSFYANKIITTGEGGMVVTNNDRLAERARRLKDLAHAPQQRFLHTELAFNYRMTNLQAAIGLAQLEEIDRFIEIKQKMAKAYGKLLSGIPGLTLPLEKKWARNVFWMYSVLVEKEFGLSRDDLMKRLKEEGIDTRTFFIPVHRQPVFTGQKEYQGLRFPVAEELSQKGFYLPSGLALTQSQIQKVCQAIKKIHQKNPHPLSK
ncbi:MAG: aminotransferase class I/II-fold pyridoxal phosphate-dependent enzyme [Candidatus Aminicenantales bacterium]